MNTLNVKTTIGRRSVQCWSTCSPYFLVTRRVKGEPLGWNKGRYVLTHKRTGLAVASCDKHAPLRILAGILGALPIQWGKIRSSKSLVGPWLAMPREVREWRQEYTESL